MQRWRRYWSAVAMAIAAVLAAGCVSDGQKAISNLTSSIANVTSDPWPGEYGSDALYYDPEHFPLHARAAYAAGVARLRGDSPATIEAGMSVVGSERIARRDGMNLHGMEPVAIRVVHYEPPMEETPRHHLGAFIHFASPVNHRLVVRMDLEYATHADWLEITSAKWSPVFTENPRTAVYVVPVAAADEAMGETGDYLAFHRALESRALPLSTPAALPAGEGEYAIFVSLRDPVREGDRLQVVLDNGPGGVAGRSADTRYMNFDGGYATALIPGRFAVKGGPPLYAKVVYHPKGGSVRLLRAHAVTTAGPSS